MPVRPQYEEYPAYHQPEILRCACGAVGTGGNDAGPRREAITMIFLVIANVPMLYFLNEDWFHTLIFTTPGKIALAICAAIILFALTQIMKLEQAHRIWR